MAKIGIMAFCIDNNRAKYLKEQARNKGVSVSSYIREYLPSVPENYEVVPKNE
jgi:hypothetical protein